MDRIWGALTPQGDRVGTEALWCLGRGGAVPEAGAGLAGHLARPRAAPGGWAAGRTDRSATPTSTCTAA